ncbi:unnamed protein product [Adineta ricciae]|uniref:Uncharacterized protein n=1 Tax=Adineta ricciae TaxID=249248 RepID=A0A816FEF2_ADIRI|nr:unnamed protein product [Adineta ricciae]
MKTYQLKRSTKLGISLLLVFIVINIAVKLFSSLELTAKSPDNVETSIITHHKQHPDCAPFDRRITPRHLFQSYFSIQQDSKWLAKPTLHSPTFQEIHRLLFGLSAPNIYATWPNYFKQKSDSTYPHTSLSQSIFEKLTEEVDIPIRFVVEVGSFMGKSAINIGKVLLQSQFNQNYVLLCIDTWLGGLEHWVQDDLREMMGMAYGRPIVYEQFIANIIASNLTDHVLPYSTTSLLGARFLLEKKLFPQIIYLDSAHLQGETYIELELYWSILQTGGILVGDDWDWKAVRCDVLIFIDSNQLNVTVLSTKTWFIKKQKRA